jgi:hypothetical protein
MWVSPASTTGNTESRNEPALTGPVLGSLSSGAAEHVLGVLEGRHPLAVLEFGVPADMIDMQVGAHHHVDLVGLDARCLQPLEVLRLHQMPLGPMRARLVVADAGVDQDALAAHRQKPAMDAELQRIRGLLVVVGHQPVAVMLHHLGLPVGEEHLGVEVGLVGFLDALHRGSAELHFGHDLPHDDRELRSPSGSREGARFVR